MKSYFLLLRLNLRNLLAGFRGAMRKPNGKIDISRLILYPLALLGDADAGRIRHFHGVQHVQCV